MSDQYEHLRSLSFPALAGALGIDISRYKTRKSGSEWYGACPIHSPKSNTTSFSYNADGRFQCFSCQAKGRGAIDLTKLILNVGFKEVCEKLGSIKPSPQQKEPRVEAPVNAGEVLKPFDGSSYKKYAVACPWLEARIPDASIREKYGVFCYNNPARKSAYSGRVMLQIKDVGGVLYGYLGRDTTGNSDSCKYLFPRDFPKSRFLFGAYELRQHLAGISGLPSSKSVYQQVYLLESPFAVMKFASLGLPAVSPFGWSVSEQQIDIIAQLARAVIFVPDRNKQLEAAGQCLPAIAARLWLRFPPLPDGIDDPEHLSLEQIQSLTR